MEARAHDVFKDLEFWRSTSYGKGPDENPECLIICPHDGSYGKLEGLFPGLEEYCELHRDVGSSALSHATGAHLEQLGVNTEVFEVVDVPRAIVDPNLQEEQAVSRVYNHDLDPGLGLWLLKVRAMIVEETRQRIARLTPNGLFIDNHTMDPYCLKDIIPVTPGTIQQHIRSIVDPRNRKSSRKVDIISEYRDKRMPSPAHPLLVREMRKSLRQAEVRFATSRPYGLSLRKMMTEYMAQNPGRGLSMDWPKDLLTVGTMKSGDYDPRNLQLSENKITNIAMIPARAVKRALAA